jgi:hypothetical protein
VVIVLRLYSFEQCLNLVFGTLIKTCNFVSFYEFLSHLGVYHTSWQKRGTYLFFFFFSADVPVDKVKGGNHQSVSLYTAKFPQ